MSVTTAEDAETASEQPQATDPRFCVHCQHYVAVKKPAYGHSPHQCGHILCADLVTGEPRDCNDMRRLALAGACGPGGNLFVLRINSSASISSAGGQP